VDIHPLVRLGVREVLAGDFEVLEACGREEALDLVRDIGDFDVAILDMGWRRNGEGASISGIETRRRIKRRCIINPFYRKSARGRSRPLGARSPQSHGARKTPAHD